MTRGIRNNNPGNIRRSKSRWKGLSKNQTDSLFCVFDSMNYGLRAMMVLIAGYIKRGYDTPRKIINRYAPSFENNTDDYLRFVSLPFDYDRPIVPYSFRFFYMIKCMCWYESQFKVSHIELKNIAKSFNLC